MKTLKITVTKRDIENGNGSDPISCPIAHAMHRHEILDDASVFGDYCEVYDGEKGYVEIPLPAKAMRFVTRFDEGKSVKPFTFSIKVP